MDSSSSSARSADEYGGDWQIELNEFEIQNELDIEWRQFSRMMVEYFASGILWLICLFMDQPDCGIPMRSWVVYYLFFRIFRTSHNAIGIALILNDTPIYYKPMAKMIIVTIFEQFEFWWMVWGEYMFFVSPVNNCKIRQNRSPESLSILDQ